MSRVIRTIMAAALACAAHGAQAQWMPQWIGTWQHPEPVRGVAASGVRATDDGVVFAAIDVTHHGRAHAALARFGADGAFAWLREHEALNIAAIERLDGDRVALVGQSAGASATVYVRVYDGATGDVVWQREFSPANLRYDERYGSRHLSVDANGNLYVLGSDDGDFVVIRYDAAGNALPAWRYATGDAKVAGSYIVALADGGAIVTGQGDSLDGGYRTVRLDAQGAALFDDTEPGDIGNPLGPSYVAAAPDGGFVVVAAPESSFGVPKAQAWKLSATGARLWTTVLPNPNAPSSLSIGAFAPLADGDVLIVPESVSDHRFRLVRVRGGDGAVMRDASAATVGSPMMLAVAPNGRALVGGFVFVGSSGATAARVAEFDANGAPCRAATEMAMSGGVAATASAGGWSVLGGSVFVQGVGNDALVRRYDANGACTTGEAIFADGFDEAMR